MKRGEKIVSIAGVKGDKLSRRFETNCGYSLLCIRGYPMMNDDQPIAAHITKAVDPFAP